MNDTEYFVNKDEFIKREKNAFGRVYRPVFHEEDYKNLLTLMNISKEQAQRIVNKLSKEQDDE